MKCTRCRSLGYSESCPACLGTEAVELPPVEPPVRLARPRVEAMRLALLRAGCLRAEYAAAAVSRLTHGEDARALLDRLVGPTLAAAALDA